MSDLSARQLADDQTSYSWSRHFRAAQTRPRSIPRPVSPDHRRPSISLLTNLHHNRLQFLHLCLIFFVISFQSLLYLCACAFLFNNSLAGPVSRGCRNFRRRYSSFRGERYNQLRSHFIRRESSLFFRFLKRTILSLSEAIEPFSHKAPASTLLSHTSNPPLNQLCLHSVPRQCLKSL